MLYSVARKLGARSGVLPLALLLFACTGSVGGNPGEGAEADDPIIDGPFQPMGGKTGEPVAERAGTWAFRRLSKAEYGNTLRDLLGMTGADVAGLPSDAFSEDGFVLPGPIGELEARRFMETAEAAVAKLNVTELTGCKAGQSDEDACVTSFITRFGRKVFRRPLEPTEAESFQAQYNKLRKELTLTRDEAVRDVVATMLQSPHFIYHRQVRSRSTGKGSDGLVSLTPHETAARLSYFLWGSLPDDELAAAADRGELATRADIERQARRMVKDARAKATLAQFHQMWLGIGSLETVQKDPAVYPSFNPKLVQAMLEENRRFVEDVFATDGKLSTLLTSPKSFVNGALAQHYGVAGVSGEGFVSTTLPQERSGILTQAAFLTKKALPGESHPVMRGNFLLVHALCSPLPAPPPNIPAPKPPAPNLSTRERFSEHGASECARACHERLDPLGFAFEGFDGVGKSRQMDGGKPVNSSGELELDGLTLRFKNAKELVGQLATNDKVRACVTKHWFGFALGRRLGDEDTGSMNVAYDAFSRADFDMRELLVALASSKTFRFRAPATGEVFQ